MRSIIMISSLDTMMNSIHEQWLNCSNYVFDNKRLSICIENETIFFDWLEDASNLYDPMELSHLEYETLYFYQICYSDRNIMKKFLVNTKFSNNDYFDNDHGQIVSAINIKFIDILDFIE